MEITYNPIRQLKNFSNSIHSANNGKEINDFEAIKSTLSFFYEKNHDLEEEIEKNLPNIPKSYLESIISIDTNELKSSRVIIYKEILTSTTKKSLKSYYDIIKNIKEHLLNENVSELKGDLNHMLVSLDKENLPIELLRKLYFEIILLFNIYFEKNKNYNDYVFSLQVMAKEFDVAEQIGYVNVSSFIRRFKQVTGMTPGEYKKSHSLENASG